MVFQGQNNREYKKAVFFDLFIDVRPARLETQALPY